MAKSKDVFGWPMLTIAIDALNSFTSLRKKGQSYRMPVTSHHVYQNYSSLAHVAVREDFTPCSAKRMRLKTYRQYPNPYFSHLL